MRFRFVLASLSTLLPAAAAASGGGEALGASLAPLWGLPFAGILLSIALFPLLAPTFWHHHFAKVAAFWGLAMALPFLALHGGAAGFEIVHVYLADYLPFIILLWSLYCVSGSILVSGSLSGSPGSNALLLVIGTLLASFVGTTGAAMLLIRPFLRANAWRRARAHQVVFFIFLVCNLGGALTPLGDPPLFLGFLHGVPFFWTLSIAPHMALVGGLLLAAFYLLDRRFYAREAGSPPDAGGARLKIEAAHNFLFLLGVVGAVLASGMLNLGEVTLFGVHRPIADLLRDAALILLGLASLKTTPASLRSRNEFSWAPIKEVAILFAAIFLTMIPVILMLKAGSHGAFALVVEAVKSPAHYFWAAGTLSAFLDNAPTYLVFLSTALGSFYPGVPEREAILKLIGENADYLKAISAGAVFMGAVSYIGNAPNFMVRSIAEEAGVEMPSFFGYILKYSLLFLIPSFALATLVFF